MRKHYVIGRNTSRFRYNLLRIEVGLFLYQLIDNWAVVPLKYWATNPSWSEENYQFFLSFGYNR